jgi:hypothetical protein
LTLRDSTLELNAAYGGGTSPAGVGRGGAVSASGTVVVNGTTFNDNVAQGGQFENTAATVAGGEGIGGAIFMANVLNVTNSTFASNHATGGSGSDANSQRGNGRGGALALSVGPTVIANVTLAYNEAASGAAGAPNTGEAFGGAILNQSGAVTLRASVVASNAPANFFGNLTDNGYNISSDASFSLINSGSLTNKDPLISVLDTNGGPTRTIAIFPESPAREAVRGAFPSLDQRGTLRPQGNFADSGAYEYVQTLPLFSVQPSGTNIVRLGTNITFQAQASGPGPIGYYWLKDSVQMTGQVSASLSITNIEPEDDGSYAIVATNSYGAATSTVVRLIVDLRPVIVTQPATNTVISPGENRSLFVDAIGPFLNYTWLKNDAPILNSNSNVLPLNGVPGVEGPYKVIVTNPSGSSTSVVANVSWSAAALTILTHPQSQTVGIGNPVTITALASGVAPIGYQWYRDSLLLLGETSPTLFIAVAARTNQGNYRVVVNNQFASITSSNALLSVVLPPEISIVRPNTNSVTITVFGDPQKTHRLLTSTNLEPDAIWTPIGSHTLPGSGSASWSVPTNTNDPPTFFRVVTP